jgi:hypothetical protein
VQVEFAGDGQRDRRLVGAHGFNILTTDGQDMRG